MHFDKYEKFGGDYHWRWWQMQGGHYRTWTLYVLDQLPEDGKGATVLDLGSGDGVPAYQLVERGYVVTGVEPNEIAREVAIDKVDATFTDEYDGGAYDYVFCLETIEHMDDPAPLVEAVLQCKEYALVTSPTKDEVADSKIYTTEAIEKLFAKCKVEVVYEDKLDRCWKITPPKKTTTRKRTKKKVDDDV